MLSTCVQSYPDSNLGFGEVRDTELTPHGSSQVERAVRYLGGVAVPVPLGKPAHNHVRVSDGFNLGRNFRCKISTSSKKRNVDSCRPN